MNNMDEDHITLGFIDIPVTYWNMTQEEKDKLCNKMIKALITKLDEDLHPEINRIAALDDIMESSIISNEMEENYEICQVFQNIRKILNEA